MVTTFAAQAPETPAGNPLKVAPEAPMVVQVMLVIAVLLHLVCALVPAAELKLILEFGMTVIEPVTFKGLQELVKVMVQLKVPVFVGVPLIVATLDAHPTVKPEGNPLKLIPVEFAE